MWREGEKEGYVRLLSSELVIASVGLYAGEATGRVYAEEVLVNLLSFLSQYDINCGSDRYRLYSIYSSKSKHVS